MSGENEHLYHAIVEHLRQWVANDAIYRARISVAGGLSEEVLYPIAKDYFVIRGIKKGALNEIAELLSDKISDWPDGLLERAAFVRDRAEEARKDGLTHGTQLSAFSKFVWFIKPHGWTMFDSLACRGLKHTLGAPTNFEGFYKALDAHDFEATIETMRGALSSTRFKALYPERILDKYLMIFGQPMAHPTIRTNEHKQFVSTSSEIYGVENLRGEIEALAASLQRCADDGHLELLMLHKRLASQAPRAARLNGLPTAE